MWPIIGHKRIIQFLDIQIKKDVLSQAYLFIGSSSLGKFTTSIVFSEKLLCLSKNSCRNCPSCRNFAKKLHPDFLLVKNEQEPISIETIREIKKEISRFPVLSSKKIIVFEEASYLTPEAQSALLKILEEPPEYVVFILVSQKENLLPTILSRCTCLYFQPVSENEIKNELLKNEELKEEAGFLAHLSAGQIGRVLKGSSFREKWQEILNDLIFLSSALVKERIDYSRKLQSEDLFFWTVIFRDLLFFKIEPKRLLNCPTSYQEKISVLANNFSRKKLISLLKKIQESKELLETTVNQKLILENLTLGL